MSSERQAAQRRRNDTVAGYLAEPLPDTDAPEARYYVQIDGIGGVEITAHIKAPKTRDAGAPSDTALFAAQRVARELENAAQRIRDRVFTQGGLV